MCGSALVLRDGWFFGAGCLSLLVALGREGGTGRGAGHCWSLGWEAGARGGVRVWRAAWRGGGVSARRGSLCTAVAALLRFLFLAWRPPAAATMARPRPGRSQAGCTPGPVIVAAWRRAAHSGGCRWVWRGGCRRQAPQPPFRPFPATAAASPFPTAASSPSPTATPFPRRPLRPGGRGCT